jgi:hypothetical protein
VKRLWVVVALLVIAPLFASRLVPGIDYPTHLSIVRLLRTYFEDRAYFHATFETNLFQPYWLSFYAPTLLLSALLPLEIAGKVVIALGLLCQPLALYLLADREGANPRIALLGSALLYGFSFYVGLEPFIIGTHLALLALVVVLRFDQKGDKLWSLHLVSVALVFAHPLAWALFTAWSSWLLLTGTRRRLLAASTATLAPLVVLFLYNRSLQSWKLLSSLRGGAAPSMSLGLRAKFFASTPFTSIAPEVEWGLLFVFVAIVAVAMVGERDRRRMLRWGGLAAIMLIAYFVVPHSALGILYAHTRVLPFALLFVLLAVPRAPRMERVAVAASMVFVAFVSLNHVFIFSRFAAESAGAVDCLPRARPKTKLVGLITERDPVIVRYPLFLHIDNYHSVWSGGAVINHLAVVSGPSTPLRYRTPPFAATMLGMEEYPQFFDYERMSPGVDYFFMHGPKRDAQHRDLDMMLLQRGVLRSKLICESGAFRLYEHVR